MSSFIQLPAHGSASWKDPVATVGALPASGNTTGDARVTLDTQLIYIWSGSAWILASGSSGVTSVGLTMPAIFSVAGSPVTSAGTLAVTLATESANTIWAGPTTGSAATPTFRSLVAADLPTGNFTDVGTDGITVTGGTSAVIGSGTSIAQHIADSTHNGYLSSTDWSTFNGKQASGNYITALTGDITASGPGSVAATLATVNSNVGSFTYASLTVNGKGLVTAASSGTAPVTTIGAFGSTPNSGGASISSNTLTLQPADGTNPGGVSTAAQTIAGQKTFSSAVLATIGGVTSEYSGSYINIGKNNTSATNGAGLTIYKEGSTSSNISLGWGASFLGSTIIGMTVGGVNLWTFRTDSSGGFGLNATQNSGIGVKYTMDFPISQAVASPVLAPATPVTSADPCLTTRNQNSTAGNLIGGIKGAGSSSNITTGVFFYNDTQISSSEDSHMEFYTAAAGTRANKLTLSKVGQLALQAAGAGISIKEGSNCKQGTATLVAGTVTVSTTAVTANSRIWLAIQSLGTVAVPQAIGVTTTTAATSFVITSASVTDTSVVAWQITEPS